MRGESRRWKNRAEEANPFLKKNLFNNSKTRCWSPSVDQLAPCHLLLRGGGNGIHQLSTYPVNKGPSARICWHRRHSHASPSAPPGAGLPLTQPHVPAWHQHPELCPFPLPISPFGSLGGLSHPGVPLHTEPSSLCSAPVSTTNNHGLPALIEALNNWEQVPTPPTKAEHSCHSRCSLLGCHKSWAILHGKQLWQNPAMSKWGPAWIPGKRPWQRAYPALHAPRSLSTRSLVKLFFPCNRFF